MLLTTEKFAALAETVASSTEIDAVAIDFETDGLSARAGDKAFLLGMCIDGVCYSVWLYHIPSISQSMQKLVSNPKIKYLAHNAKFEMAFLRHQFQAEVAGPVWDTEVFARVQYNNHMSYSLQACAERIGLSKHKPMLEWLKKNHNRYDLAPPELIIPYVELDAELSYLLYLEQRDIFRDWQTNSATPIAPVVNLELKTTKNLFEMEDGGLRLDVEYCYAAVDYETKRAAGAASEFAKLTGVPFVDSRKTLTPVFQAHQIHFGRTAKGNESFDFESLKQSRDNPIVRAILEHRDAKKRASTYWENFLKVHVNGRVYPNIRQTGAATFRMSITDPACQTWPDDSENPDCLYPIRRAFIADEGCEIVSMDYKAMELYLIADEAEELTLIEQIKSKIDPHMLVAKAADVPRGVAKGGRFAKLYGAGVKRVANTLGVPFEVALRVCKEIDRQSPMIEGYCRSLIRYAGYAPFGYNWLGRRYYFDKGFEYKYPNYRIQGGCGEILRIAINDTTELLRQLKQVAPKSRLLLPIHDELVSNIRHEDLHLLPTMRELMIKAHRAKKLLDMDVSMAKGPNFFDLEEVAV